MERQDTQFASVDPDSRPRVWKQSTRVFEAISPGAAAPAKSTPTVPWVSTAETLQCKPIWTQCLWTEQPTVPSRGYGSRQTTKHADSSLSSPLLWSTQTAESSACIWNRIQFALPTSEPSWVLGWIRGSKYSPYSDSASSCQQCFSEQWIWWKWSWRWNGSDQGVSSYRYYREPFTEDTKRSGNGTERPGRIDEYASEVEVKQRSSGDDSWSVGAADSSG
ncbi:uncharacterized protein LOC142352239 [Convolutriloba macropyga]|uniref:uncharacterized protein LOC142352239 n=1 Tax=Convolutriloba macropyga TaxID=536237 RepID=UPI003F521F8C